MQQLLEEALKLIEEMLDDPLTLSNYMYKARFKRLKEQYSKLNYNEQWISSDSFDLLRTRNG